MAEMLETAAILRVYITMVIASLNGGFIDFIDLYTQSFVISLLLRNL